MYISHGIGTYARNVNTFPDATPGDTRRRAARAGVRHRNVSHPADREAPLEPEDLERLATDADSADIFARAHNEFFSRGDRERSARCAFWLAFGLLNTGELARGGGWIARARRLLDDGQHDCVVQGYLLSFWICVYEGRAINGPSITERSVGQIARSLLPFAAILAAALFWPPAGRTAAVLATLGVDVCFRGRGHPES